MGTGTWTEADGGAGYAPWPCWMAQRLYAMLPPLVLCGPVYRDLKPRPKQHLGRYRLAQLNRYGRFLHFDVDCDFPTADAIIHDPALPPFSWAVHSHRNGHLHVAWMIAIPANDRRKDLRAMRQDIYGRLVEAVGGDTRHHGRGVNPNPFFAGRDIGYSTEWGSGEPLRLAEFHEWLPRTARLMDVPAKPGLPLRGEGRNVDLFNSVRKEAYGAARAAVDGGWTRTRFAEHVYRLAQQAASELEEPLPAHEVKATATSIARYAWRHRKRVPETRDLSRRQSDRAKRKHALDRTTTRRRDQRIMAMHRNGVGTPEIARRLGMKRGAVLRTIAAKRRHDTQATSQVSL